VGESNRLWVTVAVAVFFLLASGIAALLLRRLAKMKPRPFDATIAELRSDLRAIKS
jgi:uncharacterized membrane protein YqjE